MLGLQTTAAADDQLRGDWLIHNGRAIDARGVVDDAWFLIAGTTIRARGSGRPVRELSAVRRIDAEGRLITPGLVDIHCHGGGGFAFDDGGAAMRQALQAHRRRGTTRTVISLVSPPEGALEDNLHQVRALMADDPLVLGAHLEDPFLSPQRRGSHDPARLRQPTPVLIDSLVNAGGEALRHVTIAPELPGGMDAVERLARAGVLPAVGHTEATYEQTREAFARGAQILTHAFNAMPQLLSREPGPLAAALEDGQVVMELIVDGEHVHRSLVSLLFRVAGGRIALVTDALAAAGCGDGQYQLGALEVHVRDGRAGLRDEPGTLAGSTIFLRDALRLLQQYGVDESAAVAAATLVPAQAIGRAAHIGSLSENYAADVVIWDEDWEPLWVLANGEPVVQPPARASDDN
jgi:N-acetylglucosamine-6-phosphate deacetylase